MGVSEGGGERDGGRSDDARADARTHLDLAFINQERPVERGDHPFSDVHDLADVSGSGNQQRKLVTVETGNDIAIADGLP